MMEQVRLFFRLITDKCVDLCLVLSLSPWRIHDSCIGCEFSYADASSRELFRWCSGWNDNADDFSLLYIY